MVLVGEHNNGDHVHLYIHCRQAVCRYVAPGIFPCDQFLWMVYVAFWKYTKSPAQRIESEQRLKKADHHPDFHHDIFVLFHRLGFNQIH